MCCTSRVLAAVPAFPGGAHSDDGALATGWHRAGTRGTAGEAGCAARNIFDRGRTASAPQWHAIPNTLCGTPLGIPRGTGRTFPWMARDQATPPPTFPWDALPSTLQRMVLSRLLDVWTRSALKLRVVSRRFKAQVDDMLTRTSPSYRWTDRWLLESTSTAVESRQPRPSTGDENGIRGLGRLHALQHTE